MQRLIRIASYGDHKKAILWKEKAWLRQRQFSCRMQRRRRCLSVLLCSQRDRRRSAVGRSVAVFGIGNSRCELRPSWHEFHFYLPSPPPLAASHGRPLSRGGGGGGGGGIGRGCGTSPTSLSTLCCVGTAEGENQKIERESGGLRGLRRGACPPAELTLSLCLTFKAWPIIFLLLRSLLGT